jgi:2-oxoglutarate dehydrogenase E2 component (dihydrolipoamide succinyltransferase)
LLADVIIKVPQMAESINEGTLSTFLKQVGERIEADDEVASIETDKIDVAVTAPEGGILRELLVEEGDVVTVGQPVARLETGDEAKRAFSETAQTPKPFKEDGPATSAPELASNPIAPSQAQAPSTSQEFHAPPEAQTSEGTTKQATQSDNATNYHAPVSHGGPSRFEREVSKGDPDVKCPPPATN